MSINLLKRALLCAIAAVIIALFVANRRSRKAEMVVRQQLSEMEAVMVAGAIIGVLWVSLGYLVVSFW